VARVCDSAACICGCSLCVFFVLNLNADLGDFGDFGLRGDLGLSMKSCSLSTTVGSGRVSGCGVDFRAILPLLFFRGLFFLSLFNSQAAVGRRIADVSCAQPSGS
jgi:hypothetical protein